MQIFLHFSSIAAYIWQIAKWVIKYRKVSQESQVSHVKKCRCRFVAIVVLALWHSFRRAKKDITN